MPITPHAIVPLPNTHGMHLLLCYDSKYHLDSNLVVLCIRWHIMLARLLILWLNGLDGFADEGVYVDTYGKVLKNVKLQWGEMPTSELVFEDLR